MWCWLTVVGSFGSFFDCVGLIIDIIIVVYRFSIHDMVCGVSMGCVEWRILAWLFHGSVTPSDFPGKFVVSIDMCKSLSSVAELAGGLCQTVDI